MKLKTVLATIALAALGFSGALLAFPHLAGAGSWNWQQLPNGYGVTDSLNDPFCATPQDHRVRINGTWIGCTADPSFQSNLDAFIDSTICTVNPAAGQQQGMCLPTTTAAPTTTTAPVTTTSTTPTTTAPTTTVIAPASTAPAAPTSILPTSTTAAAPTVTDTTALQAQIDALTAQLTALSKRVDAIQKANTASWDAFVSASQAGASAVDAALAARSAGLNAIYGL